MLSRYICYTFLFASVLGIESLNAQSPRMKTEGIALGGLISKDTYLSPLNYGGKIIRYYNETNRLQSTLIGHKYFDAQLGSLENPAGNAKMYVLDARLQGAKQVPLYKGSVGTLYAGPGYDAGIGGLYNTRNGNNPATFHADANLALSFGYAYRLPWQACPILIRLSSQIDLLGVHWGQDYGESYYEMTYLSKSLNKKFNLTHWGNSYSQDIRINLDIPVYNRLIVNVMGGASFRNWTVREIENKRKAYYIGIGFTNYMKSIGGKQWLSNNNSIPF